MVWFLTSGKAELHDEDEDRKSPSGSDVRDGDGRTSRGQCRVLSLSEATALLARSTLSRSTSAADDIRRYLTDLGQRMSTHTVVLCKAVAVENTSSDTASSQQNATTDHHYILTSDTRKEQQPRPNHRSSDDLEEQATALNGNGNFAGKARQRPDITTRFRSVDGAGNRSGYRTVRRLRHRRHRHRKQVRASPFDRKYYGRRRRRTADDCGGRHADALDVERTAAIMKAFYCWNDDVASLTNQLRRIAGGAHLPPVTSSASRLRCRLLRRYDDCRDRFIDRVFRTEHGLAVSWPRQVTDVMDPGDYSALYY